MRSERVRLGQSCDISRRWALAPNLADMLVRLDERATEIFSAEGLRWPGVFIISGYRSPFRQSQVNPSAPDSLHTRCPSLAADLRVGDFPASTTPTFFDFLGTIWKAMGGRWGGDFRPEPDINHFEVLTVTAQTEVGPVAPRTLTQRPPARTMLAPAPVRGGGLIVERVPVPAISEDRPIRATRALAQPSVKVSRSTPARIRRALLPTS